jgi:hypothetical protein
LLKETSEFPASKNSNETRNTGKVPILLPTIPQRSEVGFPAGLSRPGRSREGPGTGQDRTGTGDLEGPVVPWSRGPGTKEVQKSQDFF